MIRKSLTLSLQEKIEQRRQSGKKVYSLSNTTFNPKTLNQNILNKYYDLTKLLKYNEWILFFETILLQKKDSKEILKKLNNHTKDNNLKKIIKLYN